ncbi:MAG TPA: MlaD family protein [Baekduia sp.]|nr:MlaD family protein [Baekduia sp.]
MRHGHLRSHALTVAVFTVIAAGMLLALFRFSGALSLGGSYDVQAVVPQAGSLTTGTSVTMAGARVGTVTGVARRGVGALVKVRIDDASVTPLPKDSTARLAVRTPLGENYVELLPGRSEASLEDGGLVPPAEGEEYVDVDQILSVLQGQTRRRARLALQGLGRAVDGRGAQLGRTLASAAGVLEAGSGLTARIADDRREIARLVRQLGEVTQALGERRASITTLARQGRTTFTALAGRDAAVRELLGELPGTLRQVRGTTGRLQATADTATPVVANLATALREVRPAVRRLAPAAREGRGVVAQLGTAAPPLQRTLGALRTAGPRLAGALPRIDRVFCQANPALRYLKPYIQDIISFATSLGAAANSYDAIGHTIRLMPVLNESALMGAPPAVNKAAHTLLRTGMFERAQGMSFKPFPKPGEAESSAEPGQPALAGPDDVRASGFRYTRVTPDC